MHARFAHLPAKPQPARLSSPRVTRRCQTRVQQFEIKLEQRIEQGCACLKAGAHRAPPVRRVEIPKDRVSLVRGRWAYRQSVTAFWGKRWHASSRRFLKRTLAACCRLRDRREQDRGIDLTAADAHDWPGFPW
ncbi:MAG: hypothetical protein EHM59_18410 [Betaproteobacteria bacterium]|nr:MAG: hypothetical protein EHM59_18410 [Betaproteobacteria bacterium]